MDGEKTLENKTFDFPVLFDNVDFGETKFGKNEWPSLAEIVVSKPGPAAAIVVGYVDGWAPEDSYSHSPIALGSKKMRRAFELKFHYFNNHSGGGSTPTWRDATLWFWHDLEIHPSTPIVDEIRLPTVFRSPRVRSCAWVIRELLPSDSRIATGQDLQLAVEAQMEILRTPENDEVYRPEWEKQPEHTGLRLIFRGRLAVSLVYTSRASVTWERLENKTWHREPGNFPVDHDLAEEMSLFDGSLALALWDAGERRVTAFKATSRRPSV